MTLVQHDELVHILERRLEGPEYQTFCGLVVNLFANCGARPAGQHRRSKTLSPLTQRATQHLRAADSRRPPPALYDSFKHVGL